jgi:inorganic pyrophosphatase
LNSDAFWIMLEGLVAASQVVVDRPKDTPHPVWEDVIYPLDYGYLAGTSSADGAGIDVWLGSGDRERVTGVICTVDSLKRDSEIKVLLGCTAAEMSHIQEFHTGETMACCVIAREPTS